MTNPNLLSLFSVYFIVSSFSFIKICNADRSRKLIDDKDFGYTEAAPNGPNKWGSINSDWKTCETGKLQSPIDIDVKNAKVEPANLKKAYKEAPARLVGGHDIGVEWQGDAGGIVVSGTTYNLVHCHWHVPSEHTIDGKRFDAELHLVHSNAKQENAVVSYLHRIGQQPDPFIESVKEKIKEVVGGSKGVDLGKLSGNSLGVSKRYFRYVGSLTTPPCTEGVIWTVAEKVGPISQEQIDLLKGVVPPEFNENARPIQVAGGRAVSQFEVPGEQK